MNRMDSLRQKMEQIAGDMEGFIFAEGKICRADIIFIPGNGYPDMAEKAAELYREEMAPLVLPSGRFSITTGHFGGVLNKKEKYDGEYASEWEFLKTVLVRNGVPESAVLREDQATYTYENALRSREVTDKAGLNIKKALLCCKNYHAGRALMYYQTVFPETEFSVCPVSVDGITRENWRRSPEGIREVTAEMQRIFTQFFLWM